MKLNKGRVDVEYKHNTAMTWDVARSRHGGTSPARAPAQHLRRATTAIHIGFFDGHTELVKLEKLWTYSWHRDWDTPARRPDPVP